MKYLCILFVLTVISACATQRPISTSNYESDFVYPEEIYPFKFLEKKVFEDPLGGVMLRYVDVKNTSDYITIYVYPIRAISWDDTDTTLKSEMDKVLAEVDYIVKVGQYKSRGNEVNSKFEFENNSIQYYGFKSKFTFTDKADVKYDSFAYLFISKDKFVKLRTSFNSEYSPNWSGDNIVKTLLPKIDVPQESEYMREMRKRHKEQSVV